MYYFDTRFCFAFRIMDVSFVVIPTRKSRRKKFLPEEILSMWLFPFYFIVFGVCIKYSNYSSYVRHGWKSSVILAQWFQFGHVMYLISDLKLIESGGGGLNALSGGSGEVVCWFLRILIGGFIEGFTLFGFI